MPLEADLNHTATTTSWEEIEALREQKPSETRSHQTAVTSYMQFRLHTIKLLVAGRKDGLQMVALFTEHALEIIFTLQAVLLFHLLRTAGVALGTDLQMVTWKVERQSVSAPAIRPKREGLAFHAQSSSRSPGRAFVEAQPLRRSKRARGT